jgi:hypothetical protein
VNLEELNKTTTRSTSSPTYPPPGEAPPNEPSPVDQSQSDALSNAHLTPEEQHAIDTRHNDTVDYPYAAHPEADVYGGGGVPEPERIVGEQVTSHDSMHPTHHEPEPEPVPVPVSVPAEPHEPAVAQQPAHVHDERA